MPFCWDRFKAWLKCAHTGRQESRRIHPKCEQLGRENTPKSRDLATKIHNSPTTQNQIHNPNHTPLQIHSPNSQSIHRSKAGNAISHRFRTQDTESEHNPESNSQSINRRRPESAISHTFTTHNSRIVREKKAGKGDTVCCLLPASSLWPFRFCLCVIHAHEPLLRRSQ